MTSDHIARAMSEQLLVRRAEAARMLCMSLPQLDSLRRAGTILAKKQGRSVLIPLSELTRYVESLPWDDPKGIG